MERRRRAPGSVIVIAVFAVLLLAPALLALTGRAGFDTEFIQKTEMRRPFVAPPPTSGALATAGWERDAERELADAFPLRRQMIEAYDHAKYVWLHDLATNHVIQGRDGWFFFGDEERAYLSGPAHPTDAELAQLADVYRDRAQWCARRGITYVFLLAPNKSTIYPNELPPDIVPVKPSIADRFVPLLKARGVRVVDVRAALTAATVTGEVYSKGDTHWNDSGAYLAYLATIDALDGAGVRDAVAVSADPPNPTYGEGDLLRLAGIANLVQNASVHVDFPRHAHEVGAPAYPGDPDAASFNASADATDSPSLPAAVLFGDSFSNVLRPYFAEDFRRTVLLRYVNVSGMQFDRHIVEVERPKVVVQEIVERSLVFGAQFHR